MLGSSYPGVAQFGSALEWGSRGREFDSRHSDQKTSSVELVFFVVYSGAAKDKRTPSAFENRRKTGPPLFMRCEKRRALFLIFGLFQNL